MGWRKELKKHIVKEKEFRSEVRNRLDGMEYVLKTVLSKINTTELGSDKLEHIITVLLKQNDSLMDRWMARGLPELKEYTIPEAEHRIDEYKIEEDEDIAGLVITNSDVQNMNGPEEE